MKRTKQNGITLIALVITIIVLLILAGISIGAITGDNGIIDQAQNAKNDTEYSQWEEQIDVAIIDAESKHRNPTMDDVIEELKNKKVINDGSQVDKKTGAITTNEPIYTIPDKLDDYIPFGPGMIADKNEEYTDNNGDTATIPGGFEILEDADTVDEGLVIQDEQDNQFVWVPVSQENFDTEFVREHFGTDSQKWWTGTFVTDRLSANNLYEPKADGEANSSEVEKMYRSVKYKGGFYVGRYESGTTESSGTGKRGNLVIKKGANVYNNIKWGNSMKDETGGAVEVARNLDTQNEYTTVESTLIYGVQWDAIMRWMKDVPNLTEGKYVEDSTGMGWYSDNSTHQTGIDVDSNKSNCVKNIYDLAGNVREWTMESYNTNTRVSRGGRCSNSGSGNPASSRSSTITSSSGSDIGFRVTLYLL